jgi:hypothetical protein
MRALAALALLILAALGTTPAQAGVTEGLAAYKRGDWVKARHELWRPAALERDADAQYHLGLLYRDGKGVEADWAQAATWLRLAAASGDGRAMVALGRALERGEGARRDETKALAWYTLAARTLPVGLDRDAALRGEDRIARLAPSSQRKKATSLADRWGADMAKLSLTLRVQEGLGSLGYPVGPVDGIVGPKTRGAITAYEKKNGLSVTGEPSEALDQHILAQRLAMP